MRYVRAKIGLAGHLDRQLRCRYFQPCHWLFTISYPTRAHGIIVKYMQITCWQPCILYTARQLPQNKISFDLIFTLIVSHTIHLRCQSDCWRLDCWPHKRTESYQNSNLHVRKLHICLNKLFVMHAKSTVQTKHSHFPLHPLLLMLTILCSHCYQRRKEKHHSH